MSQGRVIWITGLSGAGKTTLAKALLPHLPGAVLLDGDALREVFGAQNTAFDASGRKKLALTYARMAGLLARQGLTVIVATISLFHEVHAWNRDNLPGYMEIFLDVPDEERRRRDPKGLYAAEQTGEVRHMAGGETKVELPLRPHLQLGAECCIDAGVRQILRLVAEHKP